MASYLSALGVLFQPVNFIMMYVVSNPKVPKLEPEPSTGIGLENLRNRWNLITGSDIEIVDIVQ